MGLLDAKMEEDRSQNLRRILLGILLAVLLGLVVWWMVRYHTEKATVSKFLDALVAGQTQQAYQIWKASPSYAYQDFLDDWGEKGYYGPVKSYRVGPASTPHRSMNIVAVSIEVSPFNPYPDGSDAAAASKTKQVVLWVDRNDQSLSFPP